MSRPRSVGEGELIARLARVFSDVGYEGASMAMLASAAGLQKASLYHRFPGGKTQMAEEVLAAASNWLNENVLLPLDGPGSAEDRLAVAIRNFDLFYLGGERACLLNMLSSPRIEDGPFAGAIRTALDALVTAFAQVSASSGFAEEEARARAQRALMLIQGSLVLARGTGSQQPFRAALAHLPNELLKDSSRGAP